MSTTLKAAILALKGRIADAYTAISAKGGTLPATQDSANLPTAIASIPTGSPSRFADLSQIGYSQAYIDNLDAIDADCTPTSDDITEATPYINRSAEGYRMWKSGGPKFIPPFTINDGYGRAVMYNCWGTYAVGRIYTTTPLTRMDWFCDSCCTIKYFDESELDASAATTCESMFQGCCRAESLPKVKTSSLCTTFQSAYSGCYNIKKIDVSLLDTSGATTLRGMFGYCLSLEDVVGEIDAQSCTDMRQIVDYAQNLKNIYIKNLGCTFDVQQEKRGLTYECLLYLFQHLQNVSGYYIYIYGSINTLNATAEGQQAIAAAQAMGWTIV